MNDYSYTNNDADYDPDLIYPDENARNRRANSGRTSMGQRQQRGYEDEYESATPRRRAPQDDNYNTREPRNNDRGRDDWRGGYDEPRQPRRRVRPDAQQPSQARQQRQTEPEQNAQQRPAKAPKQPKPQRQRKPMREWGIVKFFCDSRFHAVVGVALVLLSVYLVVASISFIRSGNEDQSLIAAKSVEQIVNAGTGVANTGGPVGAKVTQSIIVQGLGLGSLALIVYLALLGLSLMGIHKRGFWSLTFKTLLVAITVSMVLGLASLWSGSEIMLGGYHGHYINQLLVSHTDWIGALLVNMLLIVALFYVYINDLLTLYNRWKAMRRARKAQAEQLRMERQEDRERVRKAMEEADRSDADAVTAEPASDETDERDPLAVGFDEHQEQHDIYAIDQDESVAEAESDEPRHDNIDLEEFGGDIDEDYASNEQQPTQAAELQQPTRVEAQPYMPQPVQSTATLQPQATVPVPTPLNPPVAQPQITDNNQAAQSTEALHLEVETNSIEKGQNVNPTIYDPTAELSRYRRPTLDLLFDRPVKNNSVDLDEQEENKDRIIKTLNDYGIAISHIHATVGPTVTLYEIIPAEGVRIAKIKRLEDDIAMSLAALGIRIIAPIPGKGTIGIEVPNKDPQTVSIRSILGSKKYQECKYQLPMAMGATITNEVYIADLCKMPHLLVAGATGTGKSVGLNTIIASLLYKKHPAELKFVLIDPKMVEFSLYSALERHFLAKLPDEEEAVVTSMDKVLATLNSLCVEMDQRYMLLRDANVRSVIEYNERFISKRLNPDKGHRYLPYIVVIVDEFADLIMTAGKDVEKPIARIAQKARAVGIHMIIATQRPTTNVITGLIKANFPGRIAFSVTQMVDSKTILDRPGANQLIGRGDMLFSINGSLERVQCAFIDTPEVQAICEHIKNQVGYEHAYYLPEPQMDTEGPATGSGSLTDRDPLFEEAAQAIVMSGVASTSSLQRRYSIGFNRAGKIMDQLERAGIVGPAQGGKPRAVLIDQIQLGSVLQSLE
jgi:S-DNA-T family DNA segregation ATPase FtsK/SpoIIIE